MRRFMRRFFLLLAFCLISGLAFADVTTNIIAKDIDVNGNIRIWTVHRIDGVEVESRYPKMDGHFVYVTRYSKQNFKDCINKTEVETYILNDVKNHSKTLIQKEFDKNAVKTLGQIRKDYNTQANRDFMDINLDTIINKGTVITEVKKEFDTNNDGKMNKEITIKQDGTKIEKDIVVDIVK